METLVAVAIVLFGLINGQFAEKEMETEMEAPMEEMVMEEAPMGKY